MSPENTGPAAVIVLAAGAGTRMKSRTPKILHEIGGRSMVGHALLAARSIEPRQLALVVRHERDLVAGHVAELDPYAADCGPGRGSRHRPCRGSRTAGAGRRGRAHRHRGGHLRRRPAADRRPAGRTRRHPRTRKATPSPCSPQSWTTPPATAGSSAAKTAP